MAENRKDIGQPVLALEFAESFCSVLNVFTSDIFRYRYRLSSKFLIASGPNLNLREHLAIMNDF